MGFAQNRLLLLKPRSGGVAFDPTTIQSKFAAWYKDETATYITDQIGVQEREVLTQNATAGQVFPGRALQFTAGKWTRCIDANSLNIGAAPFTIAINVRLDAFNVSTKFGGKFTDGLTSGEYYFSTSAAGINFTFRTSAAAYTLNLVPVASIGVWYNFMIVLSGTTATGYVDNVSIATATFSGTFGTITNNLNINAVLGTSYGAATWRDVRIFVNKALSTAERLEYYNGRYVSGFTQWWPLEGTSTTTGHSAKASGLVLDHQSSPAFVTGFWRSIYNTYGYAENATYGRIPPDMNNLDGDGMPVNDCLGNALVFKNRAKLNLAKSGSNFAMFAGSKSNQVDNLIASCNLISLNGWFNSSGVAQSIADSAVSTYCASRQFYNATTKELIVIKEGEHLTATQESQLMSYMGSPAIPTSYHANTTSLLARFTNAYSTAEKSRIDNHMRLLVASGIYAKLEGYILPAIRGAEEQLLDWITAANNLTYSGLVSQVPYRGIGGQTAVFASGFAPSAGAKYLQNDCFEGFKLCENFLIPGPGYIRTGSGGDSGTYFDFNVGRRVRYNLNDTSGVSAASAAVGAINKTFVFNRTGAAAMNVVSQKAVIGTSVTASTTRVSTTFKFGDLRNMNPIQNYGWGGALTFAESSNYTAFNDNYCDGQLAIAPASIAASGFSYKWRDKSFIDRQGDQCLWSDFYNLYYSTDGGVTTAASIAFNSETLGWFHMAHIFDNGKIVFATSNNKIYKTTTALGSFTEIIPTKNGSTYTLHTPADANFPGEYYKQLGNNEKQYLGDGTEIYVWNNYCVSQKGPAPTIVWYTFGDTVKVAYEFGQNPYLRDNGTNGGGVTGTLLGDAAVDNFARHGHNVTQRVDNKNKFIGFYGDLDRAALAPVGHSFFECKMMDHTYNQGADTWSHSIIYEDDYLSRSKGTPGSIIGGKLYWGADTGSVGEIGIWRCAPDDLGNRALHESVFKREDDTLVTGFVNYDGSILISDWSYIGTESHAADFSSPNIIWSNDLVTFHEVRLNIPANMFCQKLTRIGTKRYQLDMISDYFYMLGMQSLILTFD